ncbi:MAG TPA: hypothetical protein VK062_00515, partial [Burkholderiaceae bacterium]|nr:hypothetical protein [Burkholderiaceae bacterium]
MAVTTAKNRAAKNTAERTNEAIRTTSPQMPHLRCVTRKCSMLSQRLLRQAHSPPRAPSTNGMTKFRSGTKHRKAMNVLLPMPQIHVSRNAPQFQRAASAGTCA